MPPFMGNDRKPRRSQVVTFVLQQPNKFYTINIHDHLHEHRKKICRNKYCQRARKKLELLVWTLVVSSNKEGKINILNSSKKQTQ